MGKKKAKISSVDILFHIGMAHGKLMTPSVVKQLQEGGLPLKAILNLKAAFDEFREANLAAIFRKNGNKFHLEQDNEEFALLEE